MPRTSKKPADRVRQHRGEVRARIETYPVAGWLASAMTAEDNEVTVWVSAQDEDFPGITRDQFVQDLHKIAREATQRAAVAGEQFGYVVRTTTKDFDAETPVGLNELGYWFIRLPLEDCPTARSSHQNQGRRPTSGGVATPEWRRLRYANSYCNDAGTGWHQLGQASPVAPCPRCAGLTPVEIGPTPPAGWEYGSPIPGAPFSTAPETYPLAPA